MKGFSNYFVATTTLLSKANKLLVYANIHKIDCVLCTPKAIMTVCIYIYIYIYIL